MITLFATITLYHENKDGAVGLDVVVSEYSDSVIGEYNDKKNGLDTTEEF